MKCGNSPWRQHHKLQWATDYPDGSMTAALRETAEKYPDGVALEFYGKKTRFRELMAQIDEFARVLTGLGVGRGDAISIVMPNTPQAVIAFYAANRLGALASVLHPNLSKEELVNAIQGTHSAVLVTLDVIYPKFKKVEWEGDGPTFVLARIADGLPAVKKQVYLMKNKTQVEPNPAHRVHMWYQLRGNGAALPADTGRPEDVAAVLYSGGTTASPKGILLTNRNFNCYPSMCAEVYDRDEFAGLRSLALMPIFHGFGLGICIHGMLCLGLHVFLVPVYDMTATSKLIFSKKIGFVFGVPALFEVLSRSPALETKKCDFFELLVVAGDKVAPALTERLNRKLKAAGSRVELREAYGLTETTTGCCTNPFFAMKPGSIGIPYTDLEMCITEPGTGNVLPDGEVGEICVSGPTVMKGYLNREEENARVLLRHGDGKLWLHSGDMGYRDGDGYFFFAQRKARMIITAGYNVYPTELEAAISRSAGVQECCVVGKKNTVLGQQVMAYVVPAADTADREALRQELMRLCRESVAEYALPREIVWLDKLPRTTLGKVDFTALEESEP